jgi:hypothetical protein
MRRCGINMDQGKIRKWREVRGTVVLVNDGQWVSSLVNKKKEPQLLSMERDVPVLTLSSYQTFP